MELRRKVPTFAAASAPDCVSLGLEELVGLQTESQAHGSSEHASQEAVKPKPLCPKATSFGVIWSGAHHPSPTSVVLTELMAPCNYLRLTWECRCSSQFFTSQVMQSHLEPGQGVFSDDAAAGFIGNLSGWFLPLLQKVSSIMETSMSPTAIGPGLNTVRTGSSGRTGVAKPSSLRDGT